MKMIKIPKQDELDSFVKSRFYALIDEQDSSRLDRAIEEYERVVPFGIDQNIEQSSQKISSDAHLIMRLVATFYLKTTFSALKIDTDDENIKESLKDGNIGTAGRIIKMYTGSSLTDERELLSGRWSSEPRMALFDNSSNSSEPVFVTTKLDALCSHHFIRFGQEQDSKSYVVVGYIPRKKLGGISKINRFVNWCARRGWLQEDLTRYIGKKIEKVFETDSVFVSLSNLKHGCTAYRGACDSEATVSTTYLSGDFKHNKSLIPKRYLS